MWEFSPEITPPPLPTAYFVPRIRCSSCPRLTNHYRQPTKKMTELSCSRDNDNKSELLSLICEKMRYSHTLSDIKRTLQEEVSKPQVYSGDLKKHVKKFVNESGSSLAIENFIFQVSSQLLNSREKKRK